MKLINLDNGNVLVEQLSVADQFWSRFKGLMFTKSLPTGYGLMIKPCQSIHTFFMKYAIDVLYLDHHNEIIEIHKHINPGKVGKHVRHAITVIELPIGTIKKTNTETGHTVQVNH